MSTLLPTTSEATTYEDSGVSIEAGNALVENIKLLATLTNNQNVIGAIGGFAGLFKVPAGYKEPIIVAATDGVGTKLKIAHEMQRHDTIGIDLVAMCANDIIVTGAKPLFFLDYYATGKLDVATATMVITGITKACKHIGMSLLGGETAEMPGIYHGKDYDLAGFCVGIAEQADLLEAKNIKANDTIIALRSSGIHSNGFSLVRKILEQNKIALQNTLKHYDNTYQDNATIGELLLTPTVLYYDPLYTLIKNKKIKACAHITGGGLAENTARILPQNLTANFNLTDYKLPNIFSFLQKQGQVKTEELWRVFNCGIGMILICDSGDANLIIDYYSHYNFGQYNATTAFKVGSVSEQSQQSKVMINFPDAS